MKFLSCVIALFVSQVTAADIKPERVLKYYEDEGKYYHPFEEPWMRPGISTIIFNYYNKVNENTTYNNPDSNLYNEILEQCAFSIPYYFTYPGSYMGYFECPALINFTQGPYQLQFQGRYVFDGSQIHMNGYSSDVNFEKIPLSIVTTNTRDEKESFILVDYFPTHSGQEVWYQLLQDKKVTVHRRIFSKLDLDAKHSSGFTVGQSFEDLERSRLKIFLQLCSSRHRTGCEPWPKTPKKKIKAYSKIKN